MGVRINGWEDSHQTDRCWLTGFVKLQPVLLSQYYNYRQVSSMMGLILINPCVTNHLLL